MTLDNEGADSAAEFNLDSAMDAISAESGNDAPDQVEAKGDAEAPTGEVEQKESEPQALEMPKSWTKDRTELWAKLPREAQEYYGIREKQMLDGIEQYKGDASFARQVRDAIRPYEGMLAARGIQPLQAVTALLNAQQRLSGGTPEERKSAYEQLGRDFQIVAQPQATVEGGPSQELLQRLARVESSLTERQRADFERVQTEARQVVEQFAADPKNEYFGEVAQDMARLIKADPNLTVDKAYESAVWSNPVTRAREQARAQTALETKLRENARLEALKARTATKHNARGPETRKAPTETKGKFLDDMEDTLAEIRAREA